MRKRGIPRSNNGLARAVCVCGQCFNVFVKAYVGAYLDDARYTEVMLSYLDGRCPRAKLKHPKPELHLVKKPLHTL
jgi:hypothetical protein